MLGFRGLSGLEGCAGLGLRISLGGLLFRGLSGSGMTVSRNFPQKSKFCILSVAMGQIFFTVQEQSIGVAPADERSTRNIALTTAVANIKFFANLLMRVQSLVKIIFVVLLV